MKGGHASHEACELKSLSGYPSIPRTPRHASHEACELKWENW